MAGALRRPGKIAARLDVGNLIAVLLQFAEELEGDWRARFGFGLREFTTDRVTVREAVAMTAHVLGDPSTATYAAVMGWDRPMSEAAIVAAEHLDRYTQVHAREDANPQLWPRPWDPPPPPEPTPAELEAGFAELRSRGPAHLRTPADLARQRTAEGS